MVAPAVGATIWLWLLEPQFGVVNYLLQAAGIVRAPLAWLGEPRSHSRRWSPSTSGAACPS